MAQVPHREHKHRLVTSHYAHGKIHGEHPIGRFNKRLAVLITSVVGTMWTAYAFLFLAFISFPQAFRDFQQGDTLVGVAWISQSLLQLVLLPIIIVGQRVSAEAQDEQTKADHETLIMLAETQNIELEILERLDKLGAGDIATERFMDTNSDKSSRH